MMETITEDIIQAQPEDLNYAQLKELTRKEISNFLISKKERILLLARKLEENEKIKNKISAHVCRDFGDLISPDYIREILPDIYKEKSKARNRYNRLAWENPAKITKYDNKLIEKEVVEARFLADVYMAFSKGLIQELVELEDKHEESQNHINCLEQRLRDSEFQLIELKQQQVQTKRQETIAIPTTIWRQLQSMGSSGTTYANILIEKGISDNARITA